MRLLLLLFLFVLISFPAAAEVPPGPAADDRCAVCGMFVAPYANWVAVLETDAGELFYFDGPKDLFIYFFDLAKYQPDVDPEKVKIFVTEYYTVQLTPAKELLFVSGSDVMGPMGQEFVPIAGRAAAETFLRDHSGESIMRFDGHELLNVTESQ